MNQEMYYRIVWKLEQEGKRITKKAIEKAFTEYEKAKQYCNCIRG